MSKSSSCFPSLRCLARHKSSSDVKFKSSVRMPTIREFISSHNNAGTQTCRYDNESVKLQDWPSVGSKSSTPRYFRSTIAVKTEKAFVPLSATDSIRTDAFSKPPSANASILSIVPKKSENCPTVFMSETSFDALFQNFQEKKEAKERAVEGKKDDTNKSACKLNNPFVENECRRPKVVAITPSNRKRSANSRPLVKITFQPLLPIIKDINSWVKSESSLEIQ